MSGVRYVVTLHEDGGGFRARHPFGGYLEPDAEAAWPCDNVAGMHPAAEPHTVGWAVLERQDRFGNDVEVIEFRPFAQLVDVLGGDPIRLCEDCQGLVADLAAALAAGSV